MVGELLTPVTDSATILSFSLKDDARAALAQMQLPEDQLSGALRAVGRATSSSTITITQNGENVIVGISRPGNYGYQVMQSTITPNGVKTVVQQAFDPNGKLVHYDPKTP